MESYLPVWVSDASIILSIISFIVTAFLFLEAVKIRKSFLRRARLPEILKELNSVSKNIALQFGSWDDQSAEIIRQFVIAKELLESLSLKLPGTERRKVNVFVNSLTERKYFIVRTTITSASKDEAWIFYAGLTGVLTSLTQLQKDSRWE